MKTLAITTALALLAFPAVSEIVTHESGQFIPITCGNAPGLIRSITVQYGEQVIEESTAPYRDVEEVSWNIWANPATNSWTLTGMVGSSMCVFAFGDNYRDVNIGMFMEGNRPPPGIDG